MKPEAINKKIILTGGHAATTGVAVVDEIKKQKLPWKLYWVGAKYAVEGKNILTLEYKVMPSKGVTFLPLTMGRLQRKFTLWTIPALLKIPLGFFHAIYYLLKIKPRVVLSFGGFSSFPVVFSAKILGIPVIIHEQTSAAGRANLASARFADKIALSREESKKYFPDNKSIVTGNPVSEKMFSVKAKTKLSEMPVIFVTGGSRGSQSINEEVGNSLKTLLSKYKVIHQIGEIDYDKFKKINDSLPLVLKRNYETYSVVDPLKIVDFYDKADLVISRAGANTISEILAAKKPAIVIPLPISFLDEQTENAKIIERYGFGKVIRQKDLTGNLIGTIEDVLYRYNKILQNLNKFKSPDKEAAKKIVNLIEKYSE